MGAGIEAMTFIGTGNFVGIGNSYANEITGGAGDDSIDGASGHDTIYGLGGNDTLIGGLYNDVLDGGTGSDRMEGSGGHDTYFVDSLGDVVIEAAGAGTDELKTSLDELTLAANVEILTYVGTGNFKGTGSALKDTINGGAGNDTLTGLAGDDKLFGNDGNDSLVGGDGNDVLDGGDGSDTLEGGAGNDTYEVHAGTATIVETAAGGKDSVRTSLSALTLAANLEVLTYTGVGDFHGIGNDQANTIIGGAGTDRLEGAGGNDSLDGGAGDDEMAGGTGNDTYVVDSLGDSIDEDAGAAGGVDTVRTALAAYTLAANVENLAFTGTGSFEGTGNDGNNLMTGGAGDDTIQGLGGNDNLRGGLGNDSIEGGDGNDGLDGNVGADTMVGRAGNDTFTIDDLNDVIIEDAAISGGIDTVRTSLADYTLGEGVENLVFTGTAATGTGNDANNRMTGGTGNDTFYGLSGNDLLNGLAGDDWLFGGAGIDTLMGGIGADKFVLDAPMGGSADRIMDFSSDQSDKLAINGADYGLAAGELDASRFVVGTAATSASGVGQFVYNDVTKKLYWDADGSGSGDMVEIANFATSVPLSASDFLIL